MRKSSFVIVLIIAALFLPICGYAHPGGTDGAGGHHDRSTGEYHYHHGYSAHQHRDMDGDGKLDCPYDFDVKTNSNGTRVELLTPTMPELNIPTYAETESAADEIDHAKDKSPTSNVVTFLFMLSIFCGYYYLFFSKHDLSIKILIGLVLLFYAIVGSSFIFIGY